MKPYGATRQRHRVCLEGQIFAALKQAMSDGRTDVADHLLSALEVLAPECTSGAPLARAYTLVADPGLHGALGLPALGRRATPR